MTGADETEEVATLGRKESFAPRETKRFAAVGHMIYALTATVALALSFGAGLIWGETVGGLGVYFSLPIFLIGAAARYELSGVPIGFGFYDEEVRVVAHGEDTLNPHGEEPSEARRLEP